MTKLQKARKAIMEQLDALESGDYDENKVNGVVTLSDVLTKTYNTELRAKEVAIKALATSIDVESLDVFRAEEETKK